MNVTLSGSLPKPGEAFEIPRGAPIDSMHPASRGGWCPTKRRQTIRPHFVETYDSGRWAVITWAGTGGYWKRVYVRDGEFVAERPS